jgi:biotin carboxyl carrier protein
VADRAEGRHRFEVVVEGWRFEVAAEPARLAELRGRARRAAAEHAVHPRMVVRAQIPGRIVAVHVSAGEAVEMGRPLLSIEAMKMENEVLATRAGTIERVGVAAGARVELGDELVVIG